MSDGDEQLIPVFMPSLVSVLVRAEQEKGAPLTRTEVLSIRDAAVCVMVPMLGVPALEETRGYPDIDPENCWAEWCAARPLLLEG